MHFAYAVCFSSVQIVCSFCWGCQLIKAWTELLTDTRTWSHNSLRGEWKTWTKNSSSLQSKYRNDPKNSDRQVLANSVDTNQTAPSGSTLFAIHRLHNLDTLFCCKFALFKVYDNYWCPSFLGFWQYHCFRPIGYERLDSYSLIVLNTIHCHWNWYELRHNRAMGS